MNIIRWIKRLFGYEYIVVKGDWDNAYPCKVGKYMVYKPKDSMVWDTDLTKETAEFLADYLNKNTKGK